MNYVPFLFCELVSTILSLESCAQLTKLKPCHLTCTALKHKWERKNWRMAVIPEEEGLDVIFAHRRFDQEIEFMSMEEFLKANPKLNQLTGIEIDEETGVMCAWEEYPDGRLWHTARSEEEVNRFLNACLSRINYGSLSWVNLHVVDELGLHTKLLEFLLANDCKAEFLDLTFNGPLALKFLKRQIERGAIEELNICGEWPQKVVKKLLKLIPQPQFHELHTYGNSPLTVKYRDLLKVIEKSTTNGSQSPKKFISMRNGVLEDFPMEQTPAKSSLGVKHDYFYVEFHVWR